MTDGSTMQTSFQCAIADKKGFISSDRAGGGLSMHGVCNRLRGMQALLVEVSSLKPPCPIPPRVDVVSCTLITLPRTNNVIKKKNAATDHIRQAQPLLETN